MSDELHRISRRVFCATPLLASSMNAAAMNAGVNVQAALPSLAEDVTAYLSFGEHRAGMASELRTAEWIRERLDKLGYQTDFQRFPIRTLLQPGGQITAGSAKAELFPQWLPPAASLGKVVEAPLLPLAAEKAEPSIRIITQPMPPAGNWGAAQDAWVSEAVAKGALALVFAADERTGELYASNQHHFEPLPIPVGVLARRSLPELAAVAQGKNGVARMVLTGELADTTSINVVARKAGRGPMLVISTPLTGWFHCGGERGPGVAVLLRMAALLAKSERPVLVLGTGSHEIGHLGMAHVLKTNPPAPAEVGFWFHFGASLATTKLDQALGVKSPQFVVGTQTTQAQVRPALAPLVAGYANGNPRTPGEAGQVLGAGHTRFAGMIGTFPGFHTPADRGEAIDFVLLEKIAEASAGLIARMAALAP